MEIGTVREIHIVDVVRTHEKSILFDSGCWKGQGTPGVHGKDVYGGPVLCCYFRLYTNLYYISMARYGVVMIQNAL